MTIGLSTIASTPTTPRPPATLSPPKALTDRQREFGAVIAREDAKQQLSPEERTRKAAERFVADALVLPVLKQMRAGGFAAEPFAPSSAEKQFQSLMDVGTARRLTSATNFPLVDRIAADLLQYEQAKRNAEAEAQREEK